MSSNKRLPLSDPSSVTPGASTSSSSIPKSFKYDVFLSFRGEDTRKNFVGHLYQALEAKGIETYKDEEKIEQGERINDQLLKSIQESRFFIIVFSKTYASSSWCLDELAKIMECQKMTEHTAFPVFYDVEPTQVRKQNGPVGEAFSKHENQEAAGKWRDAMKELADLAGWELKATANGDESKSIQIIVDAVFKKLHSTNSSADGKLVGMETRISDVLSSLEIGTEDVRMIGIKGMGGGGKTTLAGAIYDQISNHFEGKSFVENVREVSGPTLSGLKKLQKRILKDVLNKQDITFSSVHDGKNMLKATMRRRKILVVLDDVDRIEQLEALAGEPDDWFKSGSRIIITTRDEQVLLAHGVNFVHDVNLLSQEEAICLFSRYAFRKEIPIQGYEELSGQVVEYADGLPLTIKVLGSLLCDKDKHEWVDVIKRLKEIPLKETLKQLELSYTSLEDDYKEIFLDIACILKGKSKEEAIRILESCGFHASYGLKVLEQRSLVTFSLKFDFSSKKYEQVLGMHDHIEEMGKNIVRREHPDEPNKHSRLWISEEIEDILANDKGTEATRCLKLTELNTNARIVMKGLGKMKNLQYLDVEFADCDDYDCATRCLKLNKSRCLNDTRQYFPNSLKYISCWEYPFLYLPKTFEANNLVGLEMPFSRMVQLWKERKKKVLAKLKFLSLSYSELTTFDFGMTPNLETLSLKYSVNLKELCIPVTCQKLKYLDISLSKLRIFDLGLTPYLETLSLESSSNLDELCMPVSCQKLKQLKISRSKLSTFDLGLAPNLETLFLERSSNLDELCMPASCQKLKHLEIIDSKLRTFDLGLTPNLETLSLAGCADFVELSVPVAHPNLKFLKLSKTRLRSLDLELIPNLERLDLDYCSDFEELHLSAECPNLKFLNLSNTPIGGLKRLVYLNLSVCAGLEKLPEDIGEFECLEELYLSATRIKHLPDSICMLKHLKYLNLDDCALLEKLPEDLGRLECLEELTLSATRIKHLPDSICMLKHLTFLKLRGCALLEKLPEDLGRLECLEKLDISHTGISQLPQSIFGLKGLHITASSKLLELYDFPSEIKTRSWEPVFSTVL